jgi:hypothetical protein
MQEITSGIVELSMEKFPVYRTKLKPASSQERKILAGQAESSRLAVLCKSTITRGFANRG